MKTSFETARILQSDTSNAAEMYAIAVATVANHLKPLESGLVIVLSLSLFG